MQLSIKNQAFKELATRELERRFSDQRENLVMFTQCLFRDEKGKDFLLNWHHQLMAKKLEEVLEGKCRRLMINIPPGHTKTEFITKLFPVWALGKKPGLNICATGYSTTLTQTYSGQARDYYTSSSYHRIFPRHAALRDDQSTKEWWENEAGGGYYATGIGGSITGRRFNIFLIDDPIKPDEAESEIVRVGVNNWYDNTVLSRLSDPLRDAVIIIMQRIHDNDLCGYLMEKEAKGTGEKWDKIILPAISEVDDEYRKAGEALDIQRFPLEALAALRLGLGEAHFQCQYQQNPTAKASQEFHEEWFRYIFRDQLPKGCRTFTTLDPAFSKAQGACETAVITGKFNHDSLYIIDVSHGLYSMPELEDEALLHVRKNAPEKLGVEAFGSQISIGPSLKNRLASNQIYSTTVEDLRQKGEKQERIRKMIPLYRNGLIYHVLDKDSNGNAIKPEGIKHLEAQLTKFPRGRLVDIIDAEQMLYDLYTLQPNVKSYERPRFEFDHFGRPVMK